MRFGVSSFHTREIIRKIVKGFFSQEEVGKSKCTKVEKAMIY